MSDPPRPGPADRVLRSLRRIPDVHRSFELSPRDLMIRYGLRADDTALLDAAGLRRTGPDGPRYDDLDAMNLSMHLAVGNGASIFRRYLPRFLRRGGGGRFEVSTVLSCPAPGHPGPCRYRLSTAQDRREVDRTSAEPATFLSVVDLPVTFPPVPAGVRRTAREVAAFDFFLLPEGLKEDLDFVRRTGIADCVATAELFVAEVRGLGLPARATWGLLVIPPFAAYHRFPEVLLDGVWVAFDPLLLGALVRWGAVPGGDWPPERPLGAALVPLSRSMPEATHNGEPILPSFPLRRLPGAPPAAS